ncbi:MAG: hypothetical protein KC425_07025 [Anaerolineales bacterium]|nr:hypothetical protein [Anaerolineales bacterium]
MFDSEAVRTFALILGASMLAALVLALLLLAIVWRQVKAIHIPPDAGFSETLLLTPFLVVVLIDLLDFGLDFLAAPVAWVLLDRMGLKALRGVSAIEALIPLTQAIPTMTLSWIAVRLLGRSGIDTTELDDRIRLQQKRPSR